MLKVKLLTVFLSEYIEYLLYFYYKVVIRQATQHMNRQQLYLLILHIWNMRQKEHSILFINAF